MPAEPGPDDGLRGELDVLDAGSWLVEPDMQLAGATVPFVGFGPCGVLVLDADEVWTMRDVSVVRSPADDLAGALPEYPHPIRSASMCPVTKADRAWWSNDRGDTAWIFGDGWLTWLFAEFADLGFSASDIATLRALAVVASPGCPRLPSSPGSG